MSFVHPPSFDDLVSLYGSVKEAVKRLSETLSAEEIVRRYSLPYHMVQVYLHDAEISSSARFSDVATLFTKLDSLKSSKGKATEIIAFLRSSQMPYEEKIRFLLDRINESPTYVREAYCLKAFGLSSNIGESQVQQLFWKYGDVGDLALIIYSQKPSTLLADEVYQTLNILSKLKTMERLKTLASLLNKATSEEAKWIARLTTRDLKIHLSERLVMRSVASTFQVSSDLLLEACTTIGVVDALLTAPKGNQVLMRHRLRPSVFVKPMLANLYTPDKVRYPVRSEYKYDGSRLQIHRQEDNYCLYSRRGLEKSAIMPDVLNIAKTFQTPSFIVDTEVVAVDKQGVMLPFQKILHRTSPKDYANAKDVDLTVRAFDILYSENMNLMNMPLSIRLEYLAKTVPPPYLAEGRTCKTETELTRYYEEIMLKGAEGIMVKNLNSPYVAGERTYTWLKLKPDRDTLDCVVVKAYYGRGSRTGLYSTFLLAVRDPIEKKLYTVGGVSSLTDQQMIDLKDKFDRLKTANDRDGIWVKPTIVMEVMYAEIQESQESSAEHTSGFGLRFPNVVCVREDKSVSDIDTLDHLKTLYETQSTRFEQKPEL